MTVREIYKQTVKDLSKPQRVRLAAMLLGKPKSRAPKDTMELDKLAVAGAKLASALGPPGEFSEWEKKG